MSKINKDINRQKVYHSLEIQLMDKSVLHYEIDEFEKNLLEEKLDLRRDYSNDLENPVIGFITKDDRVVFIKVEEIRNIILCFDFEKPDKTKEYHYNFDIMINPIEEDEIPDAIVKVVGKKKPYLFEDLDYEPSFLYLSEESFIKDDFLENGLICFQDEDGEKNYVPMVNVCCIDVTRELVYTDEMWNEYQNQKALDERRN